MIVATAPNTYYKNLTMMIIGGSLVSLLVWSKFKKQLKQLIRTKKYNHPAFEPVNQQRKVILEGCGVLNDLKENEFDSKHERIIICDKAHLKRKLAHMRREGLQQLQVVSDFDQTITAFGPPNEQELSTFGVIAKSKRVSQTYLDGMAGLYKKYSPYEKDSTLDHPTLQKLMAEWYDQTSDCIRNEHMSKELLLEALHDSNLALRYNFKQFINSLQHINLPFYIVSGGISPLILSCLDSVVCTKKFSNLFLFSQEGRFDEQGVLTEMKMVVNTSSKYEKVNKKDFDLRKNTLLFGDLHHDLYMKNELESENVISIIFLRDKMHDQIVTLQEHWDIIITGNGSYIPHQALVNYIAGQDYDNLLIAGDAREIYLTNPIYHELREVLCN